MACSMAMTKSAITTVSAFLGQSVQQQRFSTAVGNGSRVVAMATKKFTVPSVSVGKGPQTWLPGVNFPPLTEPEWLDRRLVLSVRGGQCIAWHMSH